MNVVVVLFEVLIQLSLRYPCVILMLSVVEVKFRETAHMMSVEIISPNSTHAFVLYITLYLSLREITDGGGSRHRAVKFNFPFVFTIVKEQVLLGTHESLSDMNATSRELPGICVFILH